MKRPNPVFTEVISRCSNEASLSFLNPHLTLCLFFQLLQAATRRKRPAVRRKEKPFWNTTRESLCCLPSTPRPRMSAETHSHGNLRVPGRKSNEKTSRS